MNKNSIPPIIKGRVGYNIVEYYLLLNNFEVYTPITETTKVDCIVIKNNKLSKIQIKTLQYDQRNGKMLPVRKLSNNRGINKQRHYTKDEVDFFIGVDLDTRDIYVVPIDVVIQYQSSIAISTLQPYKNKLDLLEGAK